MKLAISGSRTITQLAIVEMVLEKGLEAFRMLKLAEPTEFISGNARGVDRLGEIWAKKKGIPVRIFKPDWDRLGKKAGIVRNEEMAQEADAVIAVWDGKSRGTKHMIDYVIELDKPLFYYNLASDIGTFRWSEE